MAGNELHDIRPGLQVDIVVTTDYVKEFTDVRRAIVYEVDKNKIVLSQANPPFTRFYLNRGMVLTYIAAGKEGPIRVGVFCKMIDIIAYRIASAEAVQAVVMNMKSGAELQNLRMHFRVRPSSDQNLAIYLENERVNIIDISIGGAMLSHRDSRPYRPQDKIKALVVMDGERFEVDTLVLRVWTPYMDRRQGIEYVSLQFLNMDRRLNYLLGGKIFNIDRENMVKNKK